MRRHRVCPNPVERSPVSGDKVNPRRIAQECVVSTLIEAGNRMGRIGFAPVRRRKPGQRRARALVQLIAATGLVISLVVAATVVSIGIARAHAVAPSSHASR
jgi:hypothetical protein